jgi:site-specific recombinase XerD
LTRDASALDLRQFVAWCDQHQLKLFSVRRADIECFARTLEQRGRVQATVARRLCTVTGFYRYAEEEGLLGRSRRSTSAVLALTTNRTPPLWTGTKWALCW